MFAVLACLTGLGRGLQKHLLHLQTPETIRFEVVRMMRMLVTLTNTLDEVEGPYFITMRLDYHDCAPDDFELPAFQPMEVHTMAHVFERAPFSMCALAHH